MDGIVSGGIKIKLKTDVTSPPDNSSTSNEESYKITKDTEWTDAVEQNEDQQPESKPNDSDEEYKQYEPKQATKAEPEAQPESNKHDEDEVKEEEPKQEDETKPDEQSEEEKPEKRKKGNFKPPQIATAFDGISAAKPLNATPVKSKGKKGTSYTL